MTATEERVLITEPGVYDLPVEDYRRDPVAGGSLSSTGARKLLPPSCPAKFHAWANGDREETSTALDLGSAAHARVLGVGKPVAVLDYPDFRTKPAREARDEARAAGCIVLSPEQDEAIDAIAAAIRAHPIASSLLAPDTGHAEQTLVWQDEDTGVWRRAMLDFLPHYIAGDRLIVSDLKTVRSAEPREIERSIWSYGYHCQGEYYLDGIRALGLHGSLAPAFLLICVEKEPPYVVTVAQYDLDAQRWGRAANAAAIRTYRTCTETGVWPGYSDDVVSVTLPRYALSQLEDDALAGVIDVPDGGIIR